jgi:hypothetical protein
VKHATTILIVLVFLLAGYLRMLDDDMYGHEPPPPGHIVTELQ